MVKCRSDERELDQRYHVCHLHAMKSITRFLITEQSVQHCICTLNPAEDLPRPLWQAPRVAPKNMVAAPEASPAGGEQTENVPQPSAVPAGKSGNVGQLPRLGSVLYGPVMHHPVQEQGCAPVHVAAQRSAQEARLSQRDPE